ncbi:unnamed protein product, partial [Phaeothamnion confervicola]
SYSARRSGYVESRDPVPFPEAPMRMTSQRTYGSGKLGRAKSDVAAASADDRSSARFGHSEGIASYSPVRERARDCPAATATPAPRRRKLGSLQSPLRVGHETSLPDTGAPSSSSARGRGTETTSWRRNKVKVGRDDMDNGCGRGGGGGGGGIGVGSVPQSDAAVAEGWKKPVPADGRGRKGLPKAAGRTARRGRRVASSRGSGNSSSSSNKSTHSSSDSGDSCSDDKKGRANACRPARMPGEAAPSSASLFGLDDGVQEMFVGEKRRRQNRLQSEARGGGAGVGGGDDVRFCHGAAPLRGAAAAHGFSLRSALGRPGAKEKSHAGIAGSPSVTAMGLVRGRRPTLQRLRRRNGDSCCDSPSDECNWSRDGESADGKSADGKSADGKSADCKSVDGKSADGAAGREGADSPPPSRDEHVDPCAGGRSRSGTGAGFVSGAEEASDISIETPSPERRAPRTTRDGSTSQAASRPRPARPPAAAKQVQLVSLSSRPPTPRQATGSAGC